MISAASTASGRSVNRGVNATTVTRLSTAAIPAASEASSVYSPACGGQPGPGVIPLLHPRIQSRMKAMRASAARSTNGCPLTSTAARWIVPPVKGQGAWPG
jgi:hypothetical protein